MYPVFVLTFGMKMSIIIFGIASLFSTSVSNWYRSKHIYMLVTRSKVRQNNKYIKRTKLYHLNGVCSVCAFPSKPKAICHIVSIVIIFGLCSCSPPPHSPQHKHSFNRLFNFWFFSSQTLFSWHVLYQKCCRKKSSPPTPTDHMMIKKILWADYLIGNWTTLQLIKIEQWQKKHTNRTQQQQQIRSVLLKSSLCVKHLSPQSIKKIITTTTIL